MLSLCKVETKKSISKPCLRKTWTLSTIYNLPTFVHISIHFIGAFKECILEKADSA